MRRRRFRLAGRWRTRPGVGECGHENRPRIGDGDPLIINALTESEWQQTWSA